jgi:hypothetical protein
MAAYVIEVRDPKTTNANKLKLAILSMMGDGVNLYLFNSRTNKNS